MVKENKELLARLNLGTLPGFLWLGATLSRGIHWVWVFVCVSVCECVYVCTCLHERECGRVCGRQCVCVCVELRRYRVPPCRLVWWLNVNLGESQQCWPPVVTPALCVCMCVCVCPAAHANQWLPWRCPLAERGRQYVWALTNTFCLC